MSSTSKSTLGAPRPKVLLLVDHPPLRDTLRATLNALGLKVETQQTFNAVRPRLTPGAYAAYITDDQLPDADAAELTQNIRTFDPAVPILILTQQPNSDIASRAREVGSVSLLNKPFRLAELHATLSPILPAQPALGESALLADSAASHTSALAPSHVLLALLGLAIALTLIVVLL